MVGLPSGIFTGTGTPLTVWSPFFICAERRRAENGNETVFGRHLVLGFDADVIDFGLRDWEFVSTTNSVLPRPKDAPLKLAPAGARRPACRETQLEIAIGIQIGQRRIGADIKVNVRFPRGVADCAGKNAQARNRKRVRIGAFGLKVINAALVKANWRAKRIGHDVEMPLVGHAHRVDLAIGRQSRNPVRARPFE